MTTSTSSYAQETVYSFFGAILGVHATTHAPEINYTPAVVDIYLAQKAQFEFIPLK